MNEKFFELPEEKRHAILNAGYRVFSRNSYKKSPMSEIAAEAGISKSLLFYYFKNKQELYMYLWENCAKMTIHCLTEYGCYEQTDLFEMMYRGMKAKLQIMRRYPDIGAFVIKAFYEKDPVIGPSIQESYKKYVNFKTAKTLAGLDKNQFVEGVDLPMMYRDMYLASEGYLWEMMRDDQVDVEKLEQDFTRMIEFWKKTYFRKEEGDENARN